MAAVIPSAQIQKAALPPSGLLRRGQLCPRDQSGQGRTRSPMVSVQDLPSWVLPDQGDPLLPPAQAQEGLPGSLGAAGRAQQQRGRSPGQEGQRGDGGRLVGQGRATRPRSGGASVARLLRLAAATGRVVGLCAQQGWKRGYPETAETGEFWKATAFDPQSKLRVARAVGKRDQTLLEALLHQVQERVVGAPAFSSDQLPGYEEAIVEVFGKVPPYPGRGRPPTKKRPAKLPYG
jgi:hypothetical protein